jgi:hypothetical protein
MNGKEQALKGLAFRLMSLLENTEPELLCLCLDKL